MIRRAAAAAERPAWRDRPTRLDAAYTEAAYDSAFLADMIEIDRAFDVAIADGLDDPSESFLSTLVVQPSDGQVLPSEK
jgi:hypothetical protein